MILKFQSPDGELREVSTREAAEKLVAAGWVRVPGSTVPADIQPMTPDDGFDPNAGTVTVEQLLDMTINAQKSYLQGLSDDDLAELHEKETRKGALEHIEAEIDSRTAPDGGS